MYLNNTPVCWLSKNKNSVEMSTFGSGFMAMKHYTEYIRGLRYRLRMMGIPVEDPAFFGDNQSVLCNTSVPDSTLKKKSNSISYHHIREECTRGEWRTGYINTKLNPVDVLSKPVKNSDDRKVKVRRIVHDNF